MKKILLTISTISLLAPAMLFAQIDATLVNLPGMGAGATTFESYINTIYALTITIAAMLAVIKIVIAGVKYMTTDIVTSRGDAKKDIYGAIIGLLVVLAAVLIIEVINPQINDVTLAIETRVAPEVDTAANNDPANNLAPGENKTGCIQGVVSWSCSYVESTCRSGASFIGTVLEGYSGVPERIVSERTGVLSPRNAIVICRAGTPGSACSSSQRFEEGAGCVAVTAEDIANLPTDINANADVTDPRTIADYSYLLASEGVRASDLKPGFLEPDQATYEAMSLPEKQEFQSNICAGGKSYRVNGGPSDARQVRFYCAL